MVFLMDVDCGAEDVLLLPWRKKRHGCRQMSREGKAAYGAKPRRENATLKIDVQRRQGRVWRKTPRRENAWLREQMSVNKAV